MLPDWFNARKVSEVGATLADHFLPQAGAVGSSPQRKGPSKDGNRDLQQFSQRVAREAATLKLNLFKRAKLLNSFKWRLLEHGFDRDTADELTNVLLLQLTGLGRNPTAQKHSSTPVSTTDRRTKRIPALLTEADAHLGKSAHAEALRCLQKAIEIDPNHAFARNQIGAVLCSLGRYREAEREFRHAIDLNPKFADAQLNLGMLLSWKGDFSASETSLRRAVALDRKNSEAQVSLGLTLGALARLDDAATCFEKARRLRPGSASALCGLGWLTGLAGRFDEAERLYLKALELDPRRPFALAAISGLRRMTRDDSGWLDAVEQTLASGVPPLDEAKLRFAMGKYFDDLGSYSRAFEQYRRANDLYKLVAMKYDRTARKAFVDEQIRVYSRQHLAQRAESACESATPVFVVGMMRSGTTLMEQILASHSQAVGAGELDYWNAAAHKHREILQGERPDAGLAAKLADGYLKMLRRHSASALRVIDKATSNADHLGLIHSALPNARIVYMRRDPIDTCLSCYFQDFANVASFTLDMSDLAHYYREHHRLMSHWRAALPAGTLLEVPYAALVADQETWSRKVIEFIGLDWDPRCLDFHQTERPVVTASSWQVRQRVYSSSVGRWKSYQKFIGPLLKLRDLEA